MLANFAWVFIFSVLTIYIAYRNIVQHNETFKELFWTHLAYEVFYLSSILFVIYYAVLLTSEVIVYMSVLESCKQAYTMYMYIQPLCIFKPVCEAVSVMC